MGSGSFGLGLHILYNLVVHKMGGNIEYSRKLGKGLEIVITLNKLKNSSIKHEI